MAKSYREFAASIIETLESLGLQYAIGGSFASSAYYDYISRWAQEIGATEVWNQLLAEYRRASS